MVLWDQTSLATPSVIPPASGRSCREPRFDGKTLSGCAVAVAASAASGSSHDSAAAAGLATKRTPTQAETKGRWTIVGLVADQAPQDRPPTDKGEG
jgi:hypothetical protein